MIGADEIRARQRAVLAEAMAMGLDGVVAVGRAFYDRPGALAWLSNHFPPFPSTVFQPGLAGLGHGLLLMTPAATTLLVDGPHFRDDLVVADRVEVNPDLVAASVGMLRRLGQARLALADGELLPLPLWQAWQPLPIAWTAWDEPLWARRRRKSEAELALLRRAAAVADIGLAAAIQATLPGATEAAICAAGTAAALEAGADFVRYLRVHSGPWSAWASRWPQATGRRLEAGESVVLDIIGAVEGYGFDVLRTVTVGPATPAQQSRLAAVAVATEAATAAARPGATVQTIVQAAHAALRAHGEHEPATFVGHGIGLETVEPPLLRADQGATLLAGEVLCIEPAVWERGVGGASIEQMVVVADEPETLTRLPLLPEAGAAFAWSPPEAGGRDG